MVTRLGDTGGAKRRHEGGGVGRLGDSCGLCGDAILDCNEVVRASAEPWRLVGVPGDLAHRACANTAVAEAEEAARSAALDYQDALGWPEAF